MHIPKKYFHDRSVLLLLSINTFFAFYTSIKTLFGLDSGRATGYIIQYRGNLPRLSAYQNGTAIDLICFILFVGFILVFTTLLSMRVYHIRRHFAVAVLGMGTIVISLALIVSDLLLTV